MLETIVINDLVPEKHRNEEYVAILQRMEFNLALPEKRQRYATHEAGHLLYLMRTGLITTADDALYGGPTIFYENGALGHSIAGVTSQQALLSDDALQYTDELLDKLALVAASAGVIELAFIGFDEESDLAIKGDERMLHRHCRRAQEKNAIPFEGYSLWPSARARIAQSVQENRSEMEASLRLAKSVIFQKCFGLHSPYAD